MKNLLLALAFLSLFFSPGIFAQVNNSLDFDGSNDFVTIPASTDWALGTGDFTVEWWQYQTDANMYPRIFAINGNTFGVSIEDYFGTYKIFCWLGNSATSVNAGIYKNQWVHFAVTRSGGTVSVYKNGSYLGGGTNNGNISSSIEPLILGKKSSAGEHYGGILDEFRFWNDARTPTEIIDNMNISLAGNEAGLVAYYKFNQGTAGGDNTGLTTLVDNTITGSHNGTLTNFALTGSTSNWVEGNNPALPVGTGTIGDPYQIATLQNLSWIAASDAEVPSPNQATRWAAHYIQSANIDASITSTWNSGAGWSPIGNLSLQFTGTYNGNSKTISEIYINRPSTNYQGLFGYTGSGAAIQNLGVVNVNVSGDMVVGSLVGGSQCSISNCYGTGSVNGSRTTGGLVGYAESGTISDCYASVTTSSVGDNIGGFVGYNGSSNINNCYSTGSASGSNFVGGFVGVSYGTISNSFWDTETSGNATSAGGTGKTTAEMKTNATFLSAGWDDTIWNIGDGINDGYPYLDWQNPGGTAMPVELTSFSAATIASTVKLSWSTATEVNNYGFEVERKVGSLQSTVGNYEKIGFVNGSGNSNSTKSYSYEDKNVIAGKYSYRLKQIDSDGKFEYSKTIEVDMNSVTKFELNQNYPNPFNPTTSIRYALDSRQFVWLKVFNLLGKEVATLVNENKEAGSYLVNFNASNLSSGVYIYKLQAGTFTQTKKMTLVK